MIRNVTVSLASLPVLLVILALGAAGSETKPNVPAAAAYSPDSVMTINWQVIPAAGTVSSSADFVLKGSAGQTAATRVAGGELTVKQGFWQSFGATTCCKRGIRGNANNDPNDEVDIADLIFLVDFMFNGGPAPPCFYEADVDDDFITEINIADLIYLVDFVFMGGPDLPPCP